MAAITATIATGMPHPTKNDAPRATIAASSAHGARRVSSTTAGSTAGSQPSSSPWSRSGPVTTTGSMPTGPVGSFV